MFGSNLSVFVLSVRGQYQAKIVRQEPRSDEDMYRMSPERYLTTMKTEDVEVLPTLYPTRQAAYEHGKTILSERLARFSIRN